MHGADGGSELMASIEQRDGRLVVRYRDPNGAQRAKTLHTEKAAVIFRSEVSTDLRRGDYIDPRAGRLTVKVWAERWMAAQGHLKPSTHARYEGLLRNQIQPRWDGVRLTNVDFLDVQGCLSELGASYVGSTVGQAPPGALRSSLRRPPDPTRYRATQPQGSSCPRRLSPSAES